MGLRGKIGLEARESIRLWWWEEAVVIVLSILYCVDEVCSSL